MTDFLEKKLGILIDGVWTVKEAAVCGAAVLLVLLAVFFVVRRLVQRSQRKKNAIFSNSKNKYKSRLGKKIKY